MIVAEGIRWGFDPLAWEIIPRIHIGPLAVSPHGIGIAAGYLAGAQLMVRRARRHGGPTENDIWNTLFFALVGAIVGARLGYVFGHFSEVTSGGDDLLGVFKVYEGGISLIGGITGAVLAALPYMIRKKMGFWRTMDLAAPGLALGIVIGRIGDLIIGDHLGKPTSFPLAWRCLGEVGGPGPIGAAEYRAAFDQGSPPSLGCFDIAVHQTALYDFVSTALLLGLLLWLGKKAREPGFMILVFTVWYGSMRVITDFLRVDRRYLGLTGSQLMSLAAVLACLFLLARYRGAPPRWASPAPPEPPEDGGADAERDLHAENSQDRPVTG
ncbi:MAG TPA: prolipoprotein diacylglyceryl transferase family protein [Actinomycetota bacterium]